MPTLTATATATVAKPSRKGPDLSAAIELLFFLWEQQTQESPPTPAWFLAEAFASQQRNFKPSQPQSFLQSLLGSAYCGAEAVETYYLVVVYALILKGVYTEQDCMALARWCLMHWGIREGRDQIEHVTMKWKRRVLEVWRELPVGQGPNEVYERGHRLLDVQRCRGPKLTKKIQHLLR